jgi:hypothetical protein
VCVGAASCHFGTHTHLAPSATPPATPHRLWVLAGDGSVFLAQAAAGPAAAALPAGSVAPATLGGRQDSSLQAAQAFKVRRRRRARNLGVRTRHDPDLGFGPHAIRAGAEATAAESPPPPGLRISARSVPLAREACVRHGLRVRLPNSSMLAVAAREP